MQKSKLIIIALLSQLFLNAQNQLSFNDYIENITKHNPLLNRADNLIKGAEYEYKAARGEYDPFLSGTFDNKFYNGKNYYSVLESEIKQPLFTSQYLKAGYEYGNGAFINPDINTSAYGLPFIGIEASLLQGMFIDKRRAGVLKSKEYVSLSKAERNQITNDVLVEALNNYSEWSFITKQVLVYEYFLKLAQLRNDGISALAKAGERPAIDTVEASITYQSRLLELQSLKIELQKKYAQVNSFNWVGLGTASVLNSTALPDSLEYIYNQMKSVLLRELNNDTTNNPVIAQYIAKQEILRIDKRLKAEMIKPKLDVKYNFLSAGNNASITQYNTNNYKWGASLAFPLFLRTSRNEYKSASINVLNVKLELSSKNNELQNKINYVKQSLNVISEQLNNASRNAIFSKRLLEAEKLKFDNGESSLFLLNTRENKWLESELKLAEYKLKFIETVLNLIHLKGNLNYKL